MKAALSFVLVLCFVAFAAASNNNFQFVVGELPDAFVLNVNGNQNVPKYQYWMTQTSDVRYKVQLDQVYEATVSDSGVVSKLPGTTLALASLSYDITEPVADNGTFTFNITTTDSDGRWTKFQFVNHLQNETQVINGNVSYAFEFDIIVENYVWQSTNENATLVLELSFTFDVTEDTQNNSTEGEDSHSVEDHSSVGFSSVSSASTGGISSGISSVEGVSSGISSGVSSLPDLRRQQPESSGVSSGVSASVEVSGSVDVSASASSLGGFSSEVDGSSFEQSSNHQGEDGGEDDPNDGLVEVGDNNLALVQSIFVINPIAEADSGLVSVTVNYSSKIQIVYSHFTGSLFHDPTMGIDSSRDIAPAYTRTTNNGGSSSSSSGGGASSSSSASHLTASLALMVLCAIVVFL